MRKPLTRRDFLKLSAVSIAGITIPEFNYQEGENGFYSNQVGRVTVDRVRPILKRPDFNVSIFRYPQRDELLNIYYSVYPPNGPSYNPLWYRVWGGYIHSAYIQAAKYSFNPLVENIPESGLLGEITVPYTQAYSFDRYIGWQKSFRLYYQTTHWITGVDEGPDGRAWYQLTSEIDDYLIYYIPAFHLRQIPDEEMRPISSHVPASEKRIEISLERQRLTAFEGDQPVFGVFISSGLPGQVVPKGPQTPKGRFNISSKTPSKHMGAIQATGAPGSYVLPGVPWTTFFIFESGVAFHGTFWHANFGTRMSHGCINMRNEDAKWLFRWVTPVFETPIRDRSGWDSRGYGTQVDIV